MVGYNMDGPARDRVMKLMEEKDRMEAEIREQTTILEVNHIGMTEPLVDHEGYPRNDIDVYKVRHARQRIICLQNDHKNIMKFIERGLAQVHASAIGANGEGQSVQPASTSHDVHMNGYSNGDSPHVNGTVHEECFATVGFVFDGSPADIAGMCEHDEILQFGSINHNNFRDMAQIMDIVGHSVGQRVNVKLRRNQNVMNVVIVPRPWSQPGLLGCQINRRS